jgi:hypothetical protein
MRKGLSSTVVTRCQSRLVCGRYRKANRELPVPNQQKDKHLQRHRLLGKAVAAGRDDQNFYETQDQTG